MDTSLVAEEDENEVFTSLGIQKYAQGQVEQAVLDEVVQTAQNTEESRAEECEAAVMINGLADLDSDEGDGAESERARLIRTGQATPFDRCNGLDRPLAERVRSTLSSPHTNVLPSIPRRPRLIRGCSTDAATASDVWLDDGDVRLYRRRMAYVESRTKRRKLDVDEGRDSGAKCDVTYDADDGAEPGKYHVETFSDDEDEVVEFAGGFALPAQLFDRLYQYQQIGIKWLWELHCQNCGGIIGDEMGLGKTVMLICFIAGLHHSNMLEGPVVIVSPATMMSQWVMEFHTWWPLLRVVLLHGSGTAGRGSEVAFEELKHNSRTPAVFITTYERLRQKQAEMTCLPWSYMVLDEGHKIRNPDAEITLACKQFQTSHRVIMTGAPIQNNLTELWSLFDFVFPGKLGTLPIFQATFSDPIAMGGYANASRMQVQTAYSCAVALRDLISPYLLRRLKKDVLPDLPDKNEQVLFCPLTEYQKKLYREFLSGPEMEQVRAGRRNLLYAVDVLRKICNHPDLVDHPQRHAEGQQWLEQQASAADSSALQPSRCGKLRVLAEILPVWRSQGHKACPSHVLRKNGVSFLRLNHLFSLHLATPQGFSYCRLDGQTSVPQRMRIIEEFNTDPSVFIFLLSTRVGGLGVNLTGADRVLLYDPDWNPCTDIQARERALRIGQERPVVIYRLVCAGTIEEKIYHRQIFKQLLTNKILKDPRQRRIFKSRFLRDLFVLGEDKGLGTANSFGSSTPSQEDSRADVAQEEVGLLQKLLDSEGIRSTLSYDRVMEDSSRDVQITALEAERLATRSVEALRKSRLARDRVSGYVPTWTGRSGLAGAPQHFLKRAARGNGSNKGGRSRFGKGKTPRQGMFPSSKALLQGSSAARHPNSCEDIGIDPDAVTQRIYSFLLNSDDYSCYSEEIVRKFQDLISPRYAPLFRQTLRKLAILDTHKGMWTLKTEFR